MVKQLVKQWYDHKQADSPFPEGELSLKPLKVSGSRALAAVYVDARCVADRLDEIFCAGNWSTEIEILPECGGVKVSLTVYFYDDAGNLLHHATRQDFGCRS